MLAPIADMLSVAAMEFGDPCGVESLYVKDVDADWVGVVVVVSFGSGT